MTLEKLAQELNLEPNYIKNQWSSVKGIKLREGIDLVKIGRGPSAEYGLRKVDEIEYKF